MLSVLAHLPSDNLPAQNFLADDDDVMMMVMVTEMMMMMLMMIFLVTCKSLKTLHWFADALKGTPFLKAPLLASL